VAFRAAESVIKVRRTARNSPLRYLTMLEGAGVGFVISK